MVSSTVIQPIADRLVKILTALNVPSGPLKVPPSGWARDQLAGLPAAEIEVPDLTRRALEEAESQLGSRDWTLGFAVTLWYDLKEPTQGQVRLVQALEAFVAAIDADDQLGGLVVDAKVTSARRVYELQQSRTLVGYETTVDVLALV